MNQNSNSLLKNAKVQVKEECNPNKERTILLIFGDIIVDMLSNKKL